MAQRKDKGIQDVGFTFVGQHVTLKKNPEERITIRANNKKPPKGGFPAKRVVSPYAI